MCTFYWVFIIFRIDFTYTYGRHNITEPLVHRYLYEKFTSWVYETGSQLNATQFSQMEKF